MGNYVSSNTPFQKYWRSPKFLPPKASQALYARDMRQVRCLRSTVVATCLMLACSSSWIPAVLPERVSMPEVTSLISSCEIGKRYAFGHYFHSKTPTSRNIGDCPNSCYGRQSFSLSNLLSSYDTVFLFICAFKCGGVCQLVCNAALLLD